MRSWHHQVLGFVCLMGFLALWPAGPTQAQGSAPPKSRPALYEFGAKYCIPCKEMQLVMADLKPQYGGQVELRMVYADEERPLFEQYHIMLIPTQVFLNAEGQEVDRHIGALPKEEVVKKLKELQFIR